MISVIVRAHNDFAFIRRTLEMLLAQKDCSPMEIFVFDDRSTDGTLDVVRSFGERVVCVESDGFPYNPPHVLNRAVGMVHGDIVVFNNADAIPLDEFYIKNLIAPLARDTVAAVFANQVCRPDAHPLVRKDYERAFGDGSISAKWKHFFSLAGSAAKRSWLLKEPFDPAFQYSEDVEWSWRVKTRYGQQIVYVPEARVEHSHNYTFAQVWKRFYNEGLAEYPIFHESHSLWTVFRQICMESLRDFCYEFKNGALLWLVPGIYYRVLQKFAVYKGIRDSRKETLG